MVLRRNAGDPRVHVRDVPSRRQVTFRRLPGGQARPDGGPGRDGRRSGLGGPKRRTRARRRGRSRPGRAPPPRRLGRRRRGVRRGARRPSRPGRPRGTPSSATRPTSCRACSRTESSSTSSPTRLPPTTRCAATCHGLHGRRSGRRRSGRPGVSRQRLRSLAAHVEAMLAYRAAASSSSTERDPRAGRRSRGRRGLDDSRVRAAYGGRSSPAAWAPSVDLPHGGCRGPAAERGRVLDVVRSDSLRGWIELAGSASRSRGCPHGSAGSASASATAWPWR